MSKSAAELFIEAIQLKQALKIAIQSRLNRIGNIPLANAVNMMITNSKELVFNVPATVRRHESRPEIIQEVESMVEEMYELKEVIKSLSTLTKGV